MVVRVSAADARKLQRQAQGKPVSGPRQEPEHDLQVALIEAIKRGRLRRGPDGIEVYEPPLVQKYPELAWLFAVPNGGFRHKATALRMVEEGVESGVPDLLCPCLRLDRHGMSVPGFALELKVWPNKPRPDKKRPGRDQPAWLTQFARQGWWVAVGYDLEPMIAWIDRFFRETRPVPPIRFSSQEDTWEVLRSPEGRK